MSLIYSPCSLSPDQAAKLGKINLILIDLYHIFDKAVETVRDKGDPSNKFSIGREEMLDCTDHILEYAIEVSESPSRLEIEADLHGGDPNGSDALVKTYVKLVDTIKDGYVIPLNSYINGGDWPALEKVVNIARVQTYQAIRAFLEAIAADQSEEQESDA